MLKERSIVNSTLH